MGAAAATGNAAGMAAGVEPARGRSPATATRRTGPRPYRHALAAGAVAGAPLAATLSTCFTVSTRAPGCPLIADSHCSYRGRSSMRSSPPGMRRVRVSAICEPKPAARWIA